MLYPQLVVYETDRLLAAALRPLAEARRWTLHEPRRAAACLRRLRRTRPSVLVIKIGPDVRRELKLLERAKWLNPEAAVVAVGDSPDRSWATMAWHLGANFVLQPPCPYHLLPAVVTQLMERAVSRCHAPGSTRTAAVSDEAAATSIESDENHGQEES
jgi:DNA-binding NarL/FixJ family response regulator